MALDSSIVACLYMSLSNGLMFRCIRSEPDSEALKRGTLRMAKPGLIVARACNYKTKQELL